MLRSADARSTWLWLMIACMWIGTSVVAPAARAGDRIDLTPYMYPEVQRGDEFVYASDTAPLLIQTVLRYDPWRSGHRMKLGHSNEFGEFGRTDLYILPGRRVFFGKDAFGREILKVDEPQPSWHLRYREGEKRKTVVDRVRVRLDGRTVGSAKFIDKMRFVGFEAVETPTFQFEDAAHLVLKSKAEVEDRATGGEIVIKSRYHIWFVEGLSNVLTSFKRSVSVNGRRVESTPETREWLVSASVLGEAFPPEEPEPVEP